MEVSVRLVRLDRQPSRVADDIRAALASLGRGNTVIGGVALIGASPAGERPIEAIVVLPHGVLIVIGVDLPDPALRLEAPLGAPWKADGWPLVHDEEAINPATEALDLSQACERRIAEVAPGTAPVGTIIAVGPYVETVDQPVSDLAGPVRVLHPTPTTMLAATVSLATAHRPRSVEQARALIHGLAPDAPEFSDEVLLGEGFSRFTDDAPPEEFLPPVPAQPSRPPLALVPAPVPPEPVALEEEPVVPEEPEAPEPEPVVPLPSLAPVAVPPPPLPKPSPPLRPSPVPRTPVAAAPSAPATSRTVRWLPLGAIGLLVALVVAAVVVAANSGDTAAAPSTEPPTTAPPPTSRAPVASLTFALRAAGADQRCASHAFGDVQSSLQNTSCSGVRRASYTASIDGRAAAVTIGIVEFPDGAQAANFKAVADTPGGGGILDLATETGKWAGEAPKFENAAYASKVDGNSVRLVQAVWTPGPSTPDDPGLTRAAKGALDLPAS
jgi:hypothetical protein